MFAWLGWLGKIGIWIKNLKKIQEFTKFIKIINMKYVYIGGLVLIALIVLYITYVIVGMKFQIKNLRMEYSDLNATYQVERSNRALCSQALSNVQIDLNATAHQLILSEERFRQVTLDSKAQQQASAQAVDELRAKLRKQGENLESRLISTKEALAILQEDQAKAVDAIRAAHLLLTEPTAEQKEIHK